MAKPFSSLTVYRLRDTGIRQLSDFIDNEKNPSRHQLKRRYDFTAELFIAVPEEKPPDWIEPLEVGFGNLDDIPDSVRNNAVVILRVPAGQKEHHFALTFGFGRFLLRSGVIERNYGLRVALNAIYPKQKRRQKVNPERLRSVDSKTVAATTLRTRRQVDRISDFETFDLDTERDFLSGLTGTPSDAKVWGRRIDGSDAIHLHKSVEFAELGKICQQFEKNSKTVPQDFEWVDDIFAVRDPSLIESLKDRVLELIRRSKIEDLELAPPELIDWDSVDSFAFSFAAGDHFADPTIDEYRSRLNSKDKLDRLTLSQITAGHRLIALNAAGEQINDWSVFGSLTGEVMFRSQTYILSEGEFFEVKASYMDTLDAALGKLDEYGGNLPESEPGWSEDRYNRAAAALAGNFLLDKETVKLTSRTTPIEICDVLSTGRDLIHIKRKVNAPALSHLFSQGLVSADLLLMNDEFRKEAREKIAELEAKREIGNRFSALFPAQRGITPKDFRVVFGIIENWKGKLLAERLPFFSKVNLRRCVHDLERMGYRVAYRRINSGGAPR